MDSLSFTANKNKNSICFKGLNILKQKYMVGYGTMSQFIRNWCNLGKAMCYILFVFNSGKITKNHGFFLLKYSYRHSLLHYFHIFSPICITSKGTVLHIVEGGQSSRRGGREIIFARGVSRRGRFLHIVKDTSCNI